MHTNTNNFLENSFTKIDLIRLAYAKKIFSLEEIEKVTKKQEKHQDHKVLQGNYAKTSKTKWSHKCSINCSRVL